MWLASAISLPTSAIDFWYEVHKRQCDIHKHIYVMHVHMIKASTGVSEIRSEISIYRRRRYGDLKSAVATDKSATVLQ